MKRFIVLLCLVGLCTTAFGAPPAAPVNPLLAPVTNPPLKVAVFVEPPFVIQTKAGYGGFAIDLWAKIAGTYGWTWDYVLFKTLPEMVSAVNKGQVDIAVTDLFITSQRLKYVDFTHPFFDSGLQIMIDEDRQAGVFDLLRGLSEGGHLRIFTGGLGLLVFATVLLTVYDRHSDEQFTPSWFDGLCESFYHVMSVVMTGKSNHKSVVPGAMGHVVAAIWLVCGVTIIAYITSSITSVMTANKIHSQINGPDDLQGKTVGTILGSAGESYCHAARLDIQEFDNIETAVTALVKQQINAIVYDAPILRYYDKLHPELPITEVGPVFEPRKYGFALPQGSKLRLSVNEQLLRLGENGQLREMGTKYFETE